MRPGNRPPCSGVNAIQLARAPVASVPASIAAKRGPTSDTLSSIIIVTDDGHHAAEVVRRVAAFALRVVVDPAASSDALSGNEAS